MIDTPDLRLWQLISSAAPTGAFHFSQGLEHAIDSGKVRDVDSAGEWIAAVLGRGLAQVDVPLLMRAHAAAMDDETDALQVWDTLAHACRETAELRDEERAMGATFRRLGRTLGVEFPNQSIGYTCAFGWACAHMEIDPERMLQGYLWAWLENQILVATKLVPLGHLQAQALLAQLALAIPEVIAVGLEVSDENIGISLPGWVHASMAHELQYSRVFRS